MEGTHLLEVQITSQKEEVISKVKDSLKDTDVEELPRHRAVDIMTILGIAGSVVSLLKSLLDLYQKIKSKEIKSAVIVKNIDGESIDLANASEEEVKNYVNRLQKT